MRVLVYIDHTQAMTRPTTLTWPHKLYVPLFLLLLPRTVGVYAVHYPYLSLLRDNPIQSASDLALAV